MNSSNIIQQAQLNKWAALLSEQASSGLNVTDWCTQNEIPKSRFYYWRRKLQDSFAESCLPEIVPVSLPSAIPNVKPSILLQPMQCSAVLLTVNNVTIEVNDSTSDDLLARVIKAARYA